MARRIESRIGAGVLAATALVWLAAGLEANPAEAVQEPECRIYVEAPAVPVDLDPVTVEGEYTEDIGDPLAAVVAEESGVAVVSVAPGEEGEAMAVRITLDTSEAQAGTWALTLRGEAGECQGDLTIAGGEPDEEPEDDGTS